MALELRDTRPVYRNLTFEDYLQLPRIEGRYDILDGDLIMSPAPSTEHQWDSAELYLRIRQHVEKPGLGIALYAPVDVLVRKTPKLRTRQPDIVYLSVERTGIKSRKDLRGMQIIEVPIDLIVEILSGSDTRRELAGKLTDYASIGLKEAWLVSAEASTVEVLSLQESEFRRSGLFGPGDAIRSDALPGFELAVDELFAE